MPDYVKRACYVTDFMKNVRQLPSSSVEITLVVCKICVEITLVIDDMFLPGFQSVPK